MFDYVEVDGKRKAILNKKETAIAQGKQAEIKQAFQDWIWKDPDRRERLVALYNERFNNLRPREYDGSHLIFPGMNPEITLRPHQKNAIAQGRSMEGTLCWPTAWGLARPSSWLPSPRKVSGWGCATNPWWWYLTT